MVDHIEIRRLCREKQEAAIIARLSEVKGISLDQAMAIYFHSELSRQLESGLYGIDNLDAGYLVDDLIENEPALFTS